MARFFITGGCGFVGSNLANSLLNDGEEVVVYDNLSRKGSEKNLKWLEAEHGGKFHFINGDAQDFDLLNNSMERPIDAVYHTAGQGAVATWGSGFCR